MNGPWSFGDAVLNLRRSAILQRSAEQAMREAYAALADAEQAYAIALAQAQIRLRAEGHPATMCSDLARGDEHVAALRAARTIAEGVKEAAVQEGWRRAADRKDAQRFAAWSQARELAENGGRDDRLAFTGPLREAA